MSRPRITRKTYAVDPDDFMVVVMFGSTTKLPIARLLRKRGIRISHLVYKPAYDGPKHPGLEHMYPDAERFSGRFKIEMAQEEPTSIEGRYEIMKAMDDISFRLFP